jgi:hypothetical protein
VLRRGALAPAMLDVTARLRGEAMSLPPRRGARGRRPRWPTVVGTVLGVLFAASGLIVIGFVVMVVIAFNNWNGK